LGFNQRTSRKCLRRNCFRILYFILYGFIELQDKHIKYKRKHENNYAEGTFYLTPPHMFTVAFGDAPESLQEGRATQHEQLVAAGEENLIMSMRMIIWQSRIWQAWQRSYKTGAPPRGQLPPCPGRQARGDHPVTEEQRN
jgi:hypothetical protein